MLLGQLARRQRFVKALRRNRCLEAVERLLRPEISSILRTVVRG
jgi:hypothetical protein